MKKISLFMAFILPMCCLALTGAAAERQKLPAGFIALSESHMPYADAKAYCKQQGGRLPRINNSDSWDGKGENISVDGFGKPGRAWAEAGLPADYYWTGTEHSVHLGQSWFVGPFGSGEIAVNNFHNGSSARVVCVP